MKVTYYEDGTPVYLPEPGDCIQFAIELDSRTLQQYADGEVEITLSTLYEPGQPAKSRVEVAEQPEAASEATAKGNARPPRVARLHGPIRVNGTNIVSARHRRRAVSCVPRPRAHRTRRTRRHTSRRRATSRDDGSEQDGESPAAATGPEATA